MALDDLDLAERSSDRTTVIGAGTTAIVGANKSRISATFVNDSNETIYLALGIPAVMNQGIRLNANGGAFTIGKENPWRGEVNGICASGTKNLCVIEVNSSYGNQ